jgi:hypothetical protein
MSSAPVPVTVVPSDRTRQVVIISHSAFFYWWPLWAIGFVMAAITYATGHRVAFVPQGTQVERLDGGRDALVAPAGERLPVASDADESALPRITMTASNNPGMIWALTLCALLVITHIELRGVWSLIVMLAVGLVCVLLAIFGLWDAFFAVFRFLDVHISAAGYLAISLFLFILWLVTFFLYDRREYMIFSRGQLRVRLAIGVGEMVFDTRGMVIEKKRDAMFRHWLLGFGSGDLVVNTAGTNTRQFQMPNVLRIDHRLALIHTMLQEREVVKGL